MAVFSGFVALAVVVTLNSFETVATLGGGAFFKTAPPFVPRSKLLLKLPPYRPPCRNVAHLFTFAGANDESRNCFGPIDTYFGSKRLNPFNGISRESVSQLFSELFELFDFALVRVLNFFSVLFVALPALPNVQADESQ